MELHLLDVLLRDLTNTILENKHLDTAKNSN